MVLDPSRPWTVRLLRRCLNCGTEFCDWRLPEQWATPAIQSTLAAVAQPYLRCDCCGQARVIQVGDADLVNASEPKLT
jgi:hypothetical protein